MAAEVIQFKRRGTVVAKHGALLPSAEAAAFFSGAHYDGLRHYMPIWPGEENEWARDGYEIVRI